MRIGDPAHGPRRIELRRRELQERADLRHVFVAQRQMASGASHLLESALALDPVDRDLLVVLVAQRADVDVALDASRLHFVPLQQRMVPMLVVAVRHRDGIDRGPLTLVARSASGLLGRMLQMIASKLEWVRNGCGAFSKPFLSSPMWQLWHRSTRAIASSKALRSKSSIAVC